MNILIKLGLLFSVVFLLVGCSQSVEEVKNDENIGEKVSVKGTVEETVKIGDLSGYMLKDSNGDTISVASKDLPEEGDTVVARGILERGLLIGYYIDTDK